MPDHDPNELTDGVRRLLLGPVDSFEKLHAIIALRRAGDTPQRLVALETSTGTHISLLVSALEELTARGRPVDGPLNSLFA